MVQEQGTSTEIADNTLGNLQLASNHRGRNGWLGGWFPTSTSQVALLITDIPLRKRKRRSRSNLSLAILLRRCYIIPSAHLNIKSRHHAYVHARISTSSPPVSTQDARQVINVAHISEQTPRKYLRLRGLPFRFR